LSPHCPSENINIISCKSEILPVLYKYEMCSLKLRAEYTLRLFQNRVLRRIFGPNRELEKTA
jgi:hypothetical protein